MNFNLHFGELYSDNSVNDKNNLFENYIPKCYNVKRIVISFNCFSEYIIGLFGYCKGGNFNFHIWAWFGYFNCSRMEIRFYPLVKRLKVA